MDMTSSKLAVGILIIVGGVLAAGAVFLTWGTETTTALGITEVNTYTGWYFFNGEGYQDSSAYQHWLPAVVLALGSICAVLGLAVAGTGRASRYCAAAAGTLGLAGLIVTGLFSTWEIFKTSVLPLYTYEMGFGYGIYLALAGFALLLIASAAGTYAGRKNN